MLRQGILLAGTLIMFGCATANTTVVQCPVVRVLEDPAQMTRFKPGAGRDITDIEFNVAFLENTGAGTCEVDDDKVDVELKVLIVANRGIANISRQVTFAFFIAVVDQDRNIVIHDGKAMRNRFEGRVDFPGNQTQVIYTDEFELTIPISSGQIASNFLIFFGFELSAEDLEFNRSRRRR